MDDSGFIGNYVYFLHLANCHVVKLDIRVDARHGIEAAKAEFSSIQVNLPVGMKFECCLNGKTVLTNWH